MVFSNYIFLIAILFNFCERSLQLPNPSSPFKEVDTCECGKQNEFAPRIVGGTDVQPNINPWMVAILNNKKMHCGGSLINDRYILTAGHCLQWSKKENLMIFLGAHNLSFVEAQTSGAVPADIEKIIIHEEFSSGTKHDVNDIGLIKLKNPVTFTDKIGTVCLPKSGGDFSQKRAFVTGWGRTRENGNPSTLLKGASLKVLTNEECQKIPNVGELILDTMLCAYEHEIDACQGDSGGPLTVDTESGKLEQIGVVSWGIGCASPEIPGVYTRTSSYLEWIALHTQDANYCKH